MYNFLLNMWVMNKIDEDYLTSQVLKTRITEDEKQTIINTPQIN